MMAVLNYDEYNDINYWLPSSNSLVDYTGTNYIFSFACVYCRGWIWNHQYLHYCPYCGKLIRPITKNDEIIERLDKILKEVKEIKKELADDR